MPSTDPREARADEFYRSQVYRDLAAELDRLSSTDGYEFRMLEGERARIRREIAERCWSHCNPGNSGRYRIGLRRSDGTVTPLDNCPSYNAPRFDSRKEALTWIATQTDAPPEKLGVLDCGGDDLAEAA